MLLCLRNYVPVHNSSSLLHLIYCHYRVISGTHMCMPPSQRDYIFFDGSRMTKWRGCFWQIVEPHGMGNELGLRGTIYGHPDPWLAITATRHQAIKAPWVARGKDKRHFGKKTHSTAPHHRKMLCWSQTSWLLPITLGSFLHLFSNNKSSHLIGLSWY